MLKNLKMRSKLLLMLFAPIAGLLIFSIREVRENYEVRNSVRALNTLTGLAVRIGYLTHELQKERGLSSGFINAKGEKFRNELIGQRELVNTELKKVKDYEEANHAAFSIVRKSLDEAGLSLGKLQKTRGNVDSLEIGGSESFRFYTALIGSYMDVVAAVATASNKPEIMKIAAAYYAFVKVKEEAGKERATLNAVIAADRFDEELYQRIFAILASQKTYLEFFRKYASPAEVAAFDERANSATFGKVRELRASVLSKGMEGSFGIAPKTWFVAITEKINLMKEVEDILAKDVLKAADDLAAMQVHQIATAAEEQTAVTGEISTNIHQITGVVYETARGAHETASAASQLSTLAETLQRMVGRFKLEHADHSPYVRENRV